MGRVFYCMTLQLLGRFLYVSISVVGGSGNTGRAGWLGYVSGELGDDWPVTELEGALTCLAGESRVPDQLTVPVVTDVNC